MLQARCEVMTATSRTPSRYTIMMLELDSFEPNRTMPSSVAAASMSSVTTTSIMILRLLTLCREGGKYRLLFRSGITWISASGRYSASLSGRLAWEGKKDGLKSLWPSTTFLMSDSLAYSAI